MGIAPKSILHHHQPFLLGFRIESFALGSRFTLTQLHQSFLSVMKATFIALLSFSLALLADCQLKPQRPPHGSMTCSFYNFAHNPHLCYDRDQTAWNCTKCTGSTTAPSCLVVNSPQADPDMVDCQLGFVPKPGDKAKATCVDEHKVLYYCDTADIDGFAKCNGCSRAA